MEKRRKSKWRRWLWLGLLVGLMIWSDHEFNLRSNLLLFLIRDTDLDLLLYNDQSEDWESVFAIERTALQANLDTLYHSDGLLHCQLAVHRSSEDWKISLVNASIHSQLNIFEFDPAFFKFEAAYEGDFQLSTATKIAKQFEYIFCINANYFDENDRPLGAVIHHEKLVNPFFPNWTGYFFVKNGKPYFGPRSLLDEIEGEAEELIQGYPSIMKDSKIFDYVHLKSNPYFDGNTKTYRSLAGMRKNGNIVWILSDAGGILDVRELASLAEKLDLQHATLFDGGSSLQYRLNFEGYRVRFEAVSQHFDLSALISQLEKVHPPVYIGIHRK